MNASPDRQSCDLVCITSGLNYFTFKNFKGLSGVMNIAQDILSERQVSDWLGLSEPTLFRHRRDGTGPTFIRLSARRVACRRSAVEEWLSQRERKALSDTENKYGGAPK
jgi:predicted DNA-binding transcriptional regulator AlpA